MTNASRDENNVPTILGVLNSDGQTITPVKVNPTNHGLKIDDASTGTDQGPSTALRDQNFVPVLMAASSVDGETPVVLYNDADGNLLIDSN